MLCENPNVYHKNLPCTEFYHPATHWNGTPGVWLYRNHRHGLLQSPWGNSLLEGSNETLYGPWPRRKEQWPYKRLTQTCPWLSRSIWGRHGSVVGCCRAGGTECSSACMGTFEEGRHYLHYLHHSLASGQITGRENSPTHQQKIGLKIACTSTGYCWGSLYSTGKHLTWRVLHLLYKLPPSL